MRQPAFEPDFAVERTSPKEIWQAILDILPPAAYTCDTKGRLLYHNARATSLWGRTASLRDDQERYTGSHGLLRLDGSRLQPQDSGVAHAVHEGRSTHAKLLLVERLDGSVIRGIEFSYPVRDSNKRVLGAVSIIADLRFVLDAQTLDREPAQPNQADDATMAMIEVVLSAFCHLSWSPAALH